MPVLMSSTARRRQGRWRRTKEAFSLASGQDPERADECARGNLGLPSQALVEFFRLRACGFRRIALWQTKPLCVLTVRLRSLAQELQSSSSGGTRERIPPS
jgi:hypothetical protein